MEPWAAFIFYMQPPGKCWQLYHQNVSWVWPLASTSLQPLWSEPLAAQLDNCNLFLTGLPASRLTLPPTSLTPTPSTHIANVSFQKCPTERARSKMHATCPGHCRLFQTHLWHSRLCFPSRACIKCPLCDRAVQGVWDTWCNKMEKYVLVELQFYW